MQTGKNKDQVSTENIVDVTGRYASWDKYIVTCKARDFMTPLKNVIKVNVTDSIKTVLSAMFSFKLKALPVYDADTDKYRAFVDVFDIVSYVLNVVDKGRKNHNIDVPSDPTQVVLSNEMAELDIPVGEAMNFGQENFLFMLPETTLLREMLYVMGPGMKHRVWVYNDAKNAGVGLITQTKVLQLLQEDLAYFPDIANRSIESLGIVEKKELISITIDKKVSDGFKLLTSSHVQAIAILNQDGCLENEFSSNDVKALSLFGEFFENLEMPISEYFAKLRQYCSRPHKPPVCRKTDSVQKVMQLLTSNRAHHLFIVEDSHAPTKEGKSGPCDHGEVPVGVVSLGDVIRSLWQFCEQ